jgi:hypothetical protein
VTLGTLVTIFDIIKGGNKMKTNTRYSQIQYERMSEVPFHGQEQVADNHEGSSKKRGGTSDEFYNRGSQPNACDSGWHLFLSQLGRQL